MKRLSELSGTGGQAHREGLNQEREADKKLNKLPKPDQTTYTRRDMLRKKRNAINQHDKSFLSPQLGSHDIYSSVHSCPFNIMASKCHQITLNK